MEPANFTHAALKAIDAELSKPEERLYKQAVRFILPHDAKLMASQLDLLPEHVTLPFPVVALEYTCNESVRARSIEFWEASGYDQAEADRWRRLNSVRDKVVVIAHQRAPRSAIEISVFQCDQRRGTWKRIVDHLPLPARRQRIWQLQADPVTHAPRLSDALSITAAEQAGLIAEWLTVYEPALAVYALCEVFHSADDIGERFACGYNSARVQALLPTAHNYYHTLTMTGPETVKVTTTAYKGPKQIPEGIKRQHTRRGHWRYYASGKRVWIAPAMISEGTVSKPPRVVRDL